MSQTSYQPPVNKLLTLGDAREMLEWPNYLELGIGPEHIPDLIRMITDEALWEIGVETPETWAPIHAWRALGQLRAEAAIEPLISVLHRADDQDDEWVLEELPEVFGMIGRGAIAPLGAYLAGSEHGLYARSTAARGLLQVGQDDPGARTECITVLTTQLEQFAGQDPTLNGFLISDLVKMGASESAPSMERAFAADAVDEFVMGDWEDVQVALGLKPARERPRRLVVPLFDESLEGPEGPARSQRKAGPQKVKPDRRPKLREKAKAKRKKPGQSRRQKKRK